MSATGPLSLLLVDDNQGFLHSAKHFLETVHADCVSVAGLASNAEEALAQARLLKPQVVLVDIVMPGTSGLELIPRLRELLPAAAILAVTLYESEFYRRSSLSAGADAFVPKASLHTELIPAIRRAVAARAAGWASGG